MAPSFQPPRPEKDTKTRSILSFAVDLEVRLPTALSSTPQGSLFDDLQRHVLGFPTKLGAAAATKCEEIDGQGTSLWNLCTRLRRTFENSDNPKDIPHILLLARIFAFLLLDGALEAGNSTSGNTLRLMKIGIKAAKNCIDTQHLDLASKILEKLSGYESKLTIPGAGSTLDDDEARQRLIAVYFVLRTALAWRQDNSKLAEHMFKKCMASKSYFDPNTAESLADVLDEMGKSLLERRQYQTATEWLDRALEVLAGQELDKLSMDASELRNSITESNIKALLGLGSQETVDKARYLVDSLESEVGEKLIVLLLRLQLLSSGTDEAFDCGAYGQILRRIILSAALSPENFKLIMFHIRKLNHKSSSMALKAVDELMTLRMLKGEKDEWIEKVLITRLYMTVAHGDGADPLTSLGELLSVIAANIKQPISSTATLAAHTLLWKRIESSYTQQQYDVAEQWCRLALRPIFEKSGELNSGRISRKLLLCSLARQDFATARDVYGLMPETARNEPLTRFLMFKIAIRCDEVGYASECLEAINSASMKDPNLLYACVLDAQQANNKTQALAALELVLQKFGNGAPNGIHLPALLRLTIGLTLAAIDKSKLIEGSSEADDTVEKLCRLFEGAVTSMRKSPPLDPGSGTLWTVSELDWFSKNSYNLSIEHLSRWSPRHSLRMLQCCITFIDQYPSDLSEQVSDDLLLRKLFCEFSAAIALIALARVEDNIEEHYQDYLRLRKHVASFDNILQGKLGNMDEGPAQDLLRKLSVLIAFDFEAACQLKAWDDLGEIILKADICKDMKVYEVMADCILCIKSPTEVLVNTLKKIINAAWGLDSLDVVKLAKYMRCLFQVALPGSPNTAEQLLGQIYNLAEEATETEQPYPAEELEWITTRAYNHAVDLYCTDDDEGCKNWAGRALNLAHLSADSGAMESLLQKKYALLKFDG